MSKDLYLVALDRLNGLLEDGWSRELHESMGLLLPLRIQARAPPFA
ncbi:MAG: hypothetical protein ACJASY_001835 [Halioglobus sp.]|jgi:hypothetical protein